DGKSPAVDRLKASGMPIDTFLHNLLIYKFFMHVYGWGVLCRVAGDCRHWQLTGETAPDMADA
ncbi:hypothetical protein, partial [Stutzerimonas frequens]|uniref:hypothetical protein n=1 Tax=Stutzerimonas frequens TaxID=2968969 RepID=UPI0022DD8FCD